MTKTTALFVSALVSLLASAIGYLLCSVTWNRDVVIEAGPANGFLNQTAQELDGWLRSRGVNSRLTSRDDNSRIIADVNDPASPVNVGFLAEPVAPENFPNLTSLGTIAQAPLLVFSRAELGAAPTLDDLRGRRVEIGPPGGTTNSLFMGALQAYGLDSALKLEEHSLDTAIENVLSGRSDAVVALLPISMPVVAELAANPEIRLTSLPNARAVAATLGYTIEAITIPQGALSIAGQLPVSDVSTIAVPVTVIAKKSLADGNALKIADFLRRTFSPQSVLSPANTFPKFLFVLPPNPAAREFYASGLPREFTVLPAPVAEIFGPLVALGSLALLLITLYKFMLPDMHGTWDKILGPREREKFLSRLETDLAAGKPITSSQRKRLQRYIDRHNRDRKVWDRVERLQADYPAVGHAPKARTGDRQRQRQR